MRSVNESAFPLAHHGSFQRMVLLRVQLTCRTGLHVGAGKSIDLVGSDLPVMRDASGRPLVPGSSLRGVLRGGIEGLLETLGLGKFTPKLPEGADRSNSALVEGWENMAFVERLFGRISQESGGFSYASRLQISDFDCKSSAPVELRDGVAIDRETRTAAGGAKFDLEVVPAGASFEGRIRLRNPQDYEVGLLAQSLWMLNEGLLLLGGNSARGLGWVEVAVAEPVDLSAAEILAGNAIRVRKKGPEYKPVEENLSAYLDAARDLQAFEQTAS